MISVQEAKNKIKEQCRELPPVMLALTEAVGYTLAREVIAPIDLPPFQQSSMDGYAIAFADVYAGKTLPISASVQAGDTLPIALAKGTAVRIFTGAPVPQQADTVVMQEDVSVENQAIKIESAALAKGDNIRRKGAETLRGSVAMLPGDLLTPLAIAYLAGMGITEVSVYAKPQIALIVTGNELCLPGAQLDFGQVFESASFGLRAALKNLSAAPVDPVYVRDDPGQLATAIRESLASCSILLITGGVSVGDFDFTTRACAAAGISTIFHRVKQKPGKPLFFGKTGNTLVFGLPGNPSSVLTCFYQYVLPAISGQMGRVPGQIAPLHLPFAGTYHKKKGFTHFLKGKTGTGNVAQLGAQESYRLSSFAVANCLIEVGEETENLLPGDLATVYPLPI